MRSISPPPSSLFNRRNDPNPSFLFSPLAPKHPPPMSPKRPPRKAPKRPPPVVDPPPASSSDEESSRASDDEETEEKEGRESGEPESKSESDEGDDKEVQERPSQPKPSSPPQRRRRQQQKSQGGSSSTESESRRHTVKRIASKVMENVETPPAKKQRAEPSSASKPSAKRKVELGGSKEPKEAKRGKEKDVAEDGSLEESGKDLKKPMFQRIWGDDDEIALLQGLIEFREKEGMDPFANTGAFRYYVKKLLGQEFADNQLANKIRVLKKKYNKNEGKRKDGEDRSFSKPHEQKVFDLSKKIWGAGKGDAGGSGEQTPMSNATGAPERGKAAATSKVVTAPKPKSETSLERPKEKEENVELIPSEYRHTVSMLSCDKMLQIAGIGFDQDIFKKGWEMVEESSKEEMKERWRKLQLTVMQVLAEGVSLIRDKTNLVLEAYERASGK